MSNFMARTLTTIIGGALMVFLLVIGGPVLLGAMCVVSIIGYFELTRACKIHDDSKAVNSMELVGIISVAAWYAAIAVLQNNISMMLAVCLGVIVMAMMLIMAVYVFTFPKYDASAAMSNLFAFIYCPAMVSCIYLIRSLEYGIYLVWMIFICSWICDICAYLVGVKFGKRRFAPKLSPKKSVEGAIGGVVGSCLVGAIYGFGIIAPKLEASRAGVIVLIMAALGSLLSMIGDLGASAIKRNHDIKDYGKLIPGHGGVMDRFDSVIFVAPLVFALSLAFLKFMGI